MKIEVYECEYCNSLLRTKEEYDKCKKICTNKAKKLAEYNRKKAEHMELADYIRLNAESVYDIPKMVEDFITTNFKKEFKINKFNLTFNEFVPNTHNCPINGETNWGGEKKNVPRGYAGWEGQMAGETNINKRPIIRYDGEKIDGVFNIFDKWHALIKGINSDGGSGGEVFGIHINIFIDDFPKIKAKYEKYVVLKEKAKTATDIYKKLGERAQKEIIEQDEQLNDLKTHRQVLENLTKNNSILQSKRTQDIMCMEKYKIATKLPEEYTFDVLEYDKLKTEFIRR